MNPKLKSTIKKLPGYKAAKELIKKEGRFSTWEISGIRPIHPVRDSSKTARLNLLIHGIGTAGAYAGAQAAVDFFLCLSETLLPPPAHT